MSNNNSLNKTGKCINLGNCSNADSKKEIEIIFGDEFVCPECGLDLVEVRNHAPSFPKWAKVLIPVVVVILGCVATWMLPRPTPDTVPVPVLQEEGTVVVKDTVIDSPDVAVIDRHDTVIKEITPISSNVKQTVTVKIYSFGKYEGNLKNGYPEGDGKMTYNKRIQIAKHDTNNPPHYAENSEYFIGSWGNGDIVSGYLYDKNGNIKERIIAPKRFNVYDISKD
jgi:hypothetical protein